MTLCCHDDCQEEAILLIRGPGGIGPPWPVCRDHLDAAMAALQEVGPIEISVTPIGGSE